MNKLQKRIQNFSKETREQIEFIAKNKSKEVLEQAIEQAQLGGDY